jgi:arylsulfatase A-like enzyme
VLRAGAGSLAALALPRPARAGRGGRPPNIVFLLSDNHRADALACAGHPFVRTPNLDRLAHEGVRFANAFCTTPLCRPARASFLTGLYAWQHGVKDNTTASRWDDRHATFLELLREHAGYATAFIGKWHMPVSGLPRLPGVDRFVTFTVNDGQGKYFDCPLVVDGREEASRRSYLTEELTDRAISFVEDVRERPFCLYLSHKAAHYPWSPAPDLGEDTIVVYASDNGFLFGEHGKVELRWPFEEVLRIPLIVRDPRGSGAAGRVAPQMALNIDVAPTLLELADVAVPSEMQGASLVAALRDQETAGRRAWLVESWREFPRARTTR